MIINDTLLFIIYQVEGFCSGHSCKSLFYITGPFGLYGFCAIAVKVLAI
jgi:hypothetical protein